MKICIKQECTYVICRIWKTKKICPMGLFGFFKGPHFLGNLSRVSKWTFLGSNGSGPPVVSKLCQLSKTLSCFSWNLIFDCLYVQNSLYIQKDQCMWSSGHFLAVLSPKVMSFTESHISLLILLFILIKARNLLPTCKHNTRGRDKFFCWEWNDIWQNHCDPDKGLTSTWLTSSNWRCPSQKSFFFWLYWYLAFEDLRFFQVGAPKCILNQWKGFNDKNYSNLLMTHSIKVVRSISWIGWTNGSNSLSYLDFWGLETNQLTI